MPRQKVTAAKLAPPPSNNRRASVAKPKSPNDSLAPPGANASRRKSSVGQKTSAGKGGPHLGRHIEKRMQERELFQALEMMRQNELGENFEFQAHLQESPDAVPYHLQGNVDYDSPENLAKRRQLKSHPWVIEAVKRFWGVYEKDSKNHISKNEYLKVNMNINKALIPEISYEESRNVAMEDWENDAKGGSTMDYRLFFDSYFEMADIWCDTIDGEEYGLFLRKLFRRVTVKILTMADGTTKRVMPKDRRDEDKAMRLTLPEGALRFRYIWIDRADITRDIDPSPRVLSAAPSEPKAEPTAEEFPPAPQVEQPANDEAAPEETKEEPKDTEPEQPNALVREDSQTSSQSASSSNLLAKLKKATVFANVMKTITTRVLPPAVMISATIDVEENEDANDESENTNEYGHETIPEEDEYAEETNTLTEETEASAENTDISTQEENTESTEEPSESKPHRPANINIQSEENESQEHTPHNDSAGSAHTSSKQKSTMASPSNLAGNNTSKNSLKNMLSGKFSVKGTPTAKNSSTGDAPHAPSRGSSMKEKSPSASVTGSGTTLGRRTLRAMAGSKNLFAPDDTDRRSPSPLGMSPSGASRIPATFKALAAANMLLRRAGGKIFSQSDINPGGSESAQMISNPLSTLEMQNAPIDFRSPTPGEKLVDEQEEKNDQEITEEAFADEEPLPNEELDQDELLEEMQEQEDIKVGMYGANPYKQDFYDADEEEDNEARTNTWCVLISGKPGCGKTEVARALAEKTKMVYLNPIDLIEKAAKGQSVHSDQVLDCLANGGSITSELKGKLFQEAIKASDVSFKGCIIDDYPITSDELKALAVLEKPIRHIELEIPNEDAFDRINGRMIDPETWTVHNSRLLKSEIDAKSRKLQDGEEEEKQEEEAEPEEDNAENASLSKPADPTVVLSRLIGRPEDTESAIMTSIKSYQTLESDVSVLQQVVTPKMAQTYKVDALQSIPDIISHIQLLLDNIPLPRLPKRLTVDDGERLDMVQNLKTVDIIEGYPREMSKFAEYCPVSYKDTEKLVTADPHFAAEYRGKLYMFADEPKLNEFMQNPHVYTQNTPEPPFMRLAILGPPLSGKSTQANAIAGKYNLVHIDVQKLVDYHVSYQTEIGQEISGLLESGLPITPEIYANIIVTATKLAEESTGDSNGWILDGFPATPEQATVLVERGVIPGSVLDMNPPDGSLKDRWSASDKYPSANFVDYTSKAFSESYSKMLGVFTEAGARHNPIDCIGSMDEVTGRIMNAIDPIIPKAEEIDFGALSPADRRFGDTGNYCPVAMKDYNALIAGREDLAAVYKGYVYLFSDEESKKKFIANPSNYVYADPKAPPSVKVLVQGTDGSNKIAIARKISDETGVPYVTIDELLKVKELVLKATGAPLLPRGEDGKILDEAIASTIAEALNIELYQSNGIILVGTPNVTPTLLEALAKLHVVPEKVVSLQTSIETEMKRVFKPVSLEEAAKVVDKEKEAAKKEQGDEKEGEEDEEEDTEEKRKQAAEERQQAIQEKKQSMEEEAKENITKKHEDYVQNAESIESYATEHNMSILNIDANERESTVLMNVKNGLKKIVGSPRESMFSVPVAISPEIAQQLMDSGVRRLSKFGRYDPVQLKKEREHALQVPAENARFSSYRHHIYMFHNDANQKEFQEEPVRFLTQAHRPPFVRPQLIVLGQPKSGKSTLTQNLAKDTGAVYLNMPSVLAYAAKQPTRLGKEIRYCLNKGAPLSDELCVKGLKARLNGRDCIEKGWVLDGFPATEYQHALMQQEQIIPTNVFQLDIPEHVMHARAQIDRKQYKRSEPRLDSRDILNAQLEIYQRHSPPVFNSYNRHGLIQKMDGTQSKWSLRTNALSVVGKSLKRRQDYLAAKESGRPACVHDTGVSLEVINKNLSPFEDYCPVSYVSKGELIKCPNETDHVVEYKDVYYKCATPSEVGVFMRQPNAYTRFSLPPSLPKRLSPEETAQVDPSKIDFKGYCPVTFSRHSVPKSATYAGIVDGNKSIMASYANKIFCFADENALEMFMKSPWKYAGMRLPKKLPPKKAEITIADLPTLGYFEQTVANALVESLTDLGEKRPVYPGKGTVESALKYLAIHMKASNHANKPHMVEKYTKKLEDYVEKCQLITRVSEEMKKDFASPKTLELAKEYEDARKADLFSYLR